MSPVSRWVLMTVAVFMVGGGLFLVSWEIPAPAEQIETVIPDERFPR